MRHALFSAAFGLLLTGCGWLLDAGAFAEGQEGDTSTSGGERPNPCAATETLLASGACVAVGVRDCGAALESDATGGCLPKLPALACSSTSLTYPGRISCARVAEVACPATADPRTFSPVHAKGDLFVWADSTGVAGDGTAERPFVRIADAVKQAKSGDVITIAPGTYEENLVLDASVTLRGVCPEKVLLVGVVPGAPTIRLSAGASGSALQSLSIAGAGAGVVVAGATAVVLQELIVGPTEHRGVELTMTDPTARATAIVESCLLRDNGGTAIHADGYEVEVARSQIRDVRPLLERMDLGEAISIHAGRFSRAASAPRDVVRSRLMLHDSLIEHAGAVGVRIEASEATIDQTVIRLLDPPADLAVIGLPSAAIGVEVAFEIARGLDVPAETPVLVRRSSIEGATGAAVRAFRASVRIEDTTIRDTRAAPGECAGHGIRLLADRLVPAEVTVVDSLVEGSVETGVHVLGGSASITGSIVRDTRASGCGDRTGDAIAIHAQPLKGMQGEVSAALSLSRSRIDAGARAGVASFSSAISLEDVLITGVAIPLLRGGYAEEDAATGDARFTVTGALHCGNDHEIAPCDAAPPLRAEEPALFSRTPDGDRASVVTRSGAPTLGQELVDDYVFWVLGHDDVPASVSDQTGVFRNPHVPADRQLILAVYRRDIGAKVIPGRTSSVDGTIGTGVFSLRFLSEHIAPLAGPGAFDWSKARLDVSVWGGHGSEAGWIFQIDAEGGGKLFYTGEDGLPVPADVPQETSAAGWAAVLDLSPGLVGVDAIPVSDIGPFRCVAKTDGLSHGIGGPEEPLVVPVFPGVWTDTALRCERFEE
jgi:hypothetical protein